jgi:hypothetical protein
MPACGGKEALVGGDAETIDLRVGRVYGTRADS